MVLKVGNRSSNVLQHALGAILVRKIKEEYLQYDNPPRDHVWGAITTFFSGSGPEGREKATCFIKDIIQPHMNHATFPYLVYQAIVSKNMILGTCCKLRLRLLEGLCEYFHISKNVIQNDYNKKLGQFRCDSSTVPSMAFMDGYQMRLNHMLELLNKNAQFKKMLGRTTIQKRSHHPRRDDKKGLS